eukprot:jgi/Phyca11/537083/estExt2_fgenesh1_pg.C_PHYCAscaffold_730001
MAPTRSSVLLLATASALASQGHADAAPCDADKYSKVATAVQTLHANCASWAAYLANGGVWTCDSKCHDAVVNLQTTAAQDIWAVESVVHSILFYLDLRTFGAVLHFIQAAPELQMYLKDDALWTQLSKVHFGGPRSPEMTVEPLPSQNRKWPWTSRERTCVQLQEFLQSMDDLTRFDEVVSVVAGDIQHVNAVDGQPLDGIVFPTNPNLTNFHIGAAAAVFKRAGSGLEQFVNDPSFQGARPIGSAVVTPAFDAGCCEKICSVS